MKKIIALGVFAALGLSQQAMAIDGTIKFEGEITANPCVVAVESVKQTVLMGQVKANTFAAKGDASVLTPFQIKLEECVIDPVTGLKADIGFVGMSADGDSTLLNVSTIAGSAKNVGLQLTDKDSNQIDLNDVSAEFDLVAGQNILNFGARYVATAAMVTPGHANGSVDFQLNYK